MCEEINLPVLDILYKDNCVEQKLQNFQQRKEINKYIHIKNESLIENKKILLIDDVITSGSTLKCCIDLIKKYKPKKIELLVLLKELSET